MKKIFLVFLLFISSGFAALNVGLLIEEGAKFDKKNVEIQGEVVGAIMHRKDGDWLNVLTSDGNAIGVFAPKRLCNDIKITGSHKSRGDIVFVRGVFRRFAQDHSGETMIAAQDITLLAPGHQIKHPLSRSKLLVAIAIWLLVVIFSFNRIIRSLRFFSIRLSRLVRR
jgi:hypothetical protein